MPSEEFDEYARDYDEILRESVGFLGKNTDYYSQMKVNVLKRHVPERVNSILEYGCGTGRSFKHLRERFPEARLFGCDVSEESLQVARKCNPTATCLNMDQVCRESDGFDIVLLPNVLHHVPPGEREKVMTEVRGLVKTGGKLCIVEHNPLNILVRLIVKKCPLDRNAVLLSLRESKRLLGGFTRVASGYFLFFPASLSCLARVEPLFSQVPLGGQFYIIAENRA